MTALDPFKLSPGPGKVRFILKWLHFPFHNVPRAILKFCGLDLVSVIYCLWVFKKIWLCRWMDIMFFSEWWFDNLFLLNAILETKLKLPLALETLLWSRLCCFHTTAWIWQCRPLKDKPRHIKTFKEFIWAKINLNRLPGSSQEKQKTKNKQNPVNIPVSIKQPLWSRKHSQKRCKRYYLPKIKSHSQR